MRTNELDSSVTTLKSYLLNFIHTTKDRRGVLLMGTDKTLVPAPGGTEGSLLQNVDFIFI